MTHQKYKQMHSTGTESEARAQWSSPAGICRSHTVCMDVLHTGSTFYSARHMADMQGGVTPMNSTVPVATKHLDPVQ